MPSLTVPVRYYRGMTDPGVPCVEANFGYREKTLEIPSDEAALVLVDVWDTHTVASHLARTHDITVSRIAPVVAAARGAGIAVVHAPAPEVARKYPQWARFAGDADRDPPEPAAPAWPPPEFIRRQGRYAAYARPEEPVAVAWRAEREPAKRIEPAVEPQPDDFVVATGSQLQCVLRQRRILHLFYAGFATNFCVPNRDYGMRAFSARGYNLILLRDCTTAVECHDTVEEQLMTRLATRQIEWSMGYSATSSDFIQACQLANGT